MNKEKEEAILIMLFIYNELYYSNVTLKSVSKLLRHIRMNMNKLSESEYTMYKEKIHCARNKAIDEITTKGEKYIALGDHIAQTFYDALSDNKFVHMWFTEKTITRAINSIEENNTRQNDEKVDLFMNNARKIVSLFLKHVGIKKVNKLTSIKYTIEQNIIIEKG